MKFCEKCGYQNEDNALFCENCGEKFESMGGSFKTEEDITSTNEKYYEFFISTNEKATAVLGNNYLQRYVSQKTLSEAFICVTNKRIYFKGEGFYDLTNFCKGIQNQVVDLKDVTGVTTTSIENTIQLIKGTGFLFVAFLAIIVASSGNEMLANIGTIVGLALLLPGVMSIIQYFMSKKSLLQVFFAGGFIALDINGYSETAINNLVSTIFIEKSKVQGK